MSEEKKATPPEDITPPAPDVPVADDQILRQPHGNDSSVDDTVNDATQKMADDIESGRSPYNYGPAGAQDGETTRPSGETADSSIGVVALTLAVVVVAVAVAFGWSKFEDVSGKLENMTLQVSELSSQLIEQREAGKLTAKAIIRMELRKSLNALERTIALGDARITARALELRDEVSNMLASMEGRAVEPALEKPVESKPMVDIAQPSGIEKTEARTILEPEAPTVDEEASGIAEEPALPEGEKGEIVENTAPEVKAEGELGSAGLEPKESSIEVNPQPAQDHNAHGEDSSIAAPEADKAGGQNSVPEKKEPSQPVAPVVEPNEAPPQ